MNFCFKCGAKIENEGQKFCIKCGTNLMEREEKQIDDLKSRNSNEDFDSLYDGLDDSSKVSRIIDDYEKLIESGLNNEALNLIDYALEIDPNNDEILNDKANVYSRLNEDDKALLYYNKSLEINPNNSNTLSNLGYHYQKLGKYDLAIETFDKALAMDRNNLSALNNKAATLHKLGMYN